ncbi:uncharacterized protein LOC118438993 [Folsomia candida]|uniref:Uncharacterized protein n=1 Tax=Folsomia candida TaxID=158441 RepID=A0A226D9J1_FOLCA|nr:uncharacterized protein LOC118438993 [Folsomia candida]OXA41538.1 hypothetical protein Fcan01_23792 [Folsomia candida]
MTEANRELAVLLLRTMGVVYTNGQILAPGSPLPHHHPVPATIQSGQTSSTEAPLFLLVNNMTEANHEIAVLFLRTMGEVCSNGQILPQITDVATIQYVRERVDSYLEQLLAESAADDWTDVEDDDDDDDDADDRAPVESQPN